MSPTAAHVVPLTAEHHEQAWRLGRLAFGGDPAADPPPVEEPASSDAWGVLDARGRLVAKARLLDHGQWWGGRSVPMGGVAGVAVHPDARGSGVAGRLLRTLADAMQERGQGISALFPTTVGLYRRLGWEVSGTLDETVLTTRALADAGAAPGAPKVTVRSADPDEAATVHELYSRWAAGGSGALTREGRGFPDGRGVAFESDVVAVATAQDGTALGYVSYDRGRGYDERAELVLWELVAHEPAAACALLESVGRWHPVAPSTRWHGPTAELARLLPTLVPAPVRSRPWMLRVVDPELAVSARGWATDLDLRLRVSDPERGDRTWHLRVRDGQGHLEPATGDAPTLHTRGLALLFAGAADTSAVRRLGLLDGPLPGLDAAVAGPVPALLDYF